MPAVSKAQRQAMAIAEHHPGKLYARNIALLKMKKKQLHEYASTKETNLPKHVKREGRKRAIGRLARKAANR